MPLLFKDPVNADPLMVTSHVRNEGVAFIGGTKIDLRLDNLETTVNTIPDQLR